MAENETMSKIQMLVIGIVITLIICVAAYVSSAVLALRMNGISGSGRVVQVLHEGTDSNDRDIRIVMSRGGADDIMLAKISRNALGVWGVDFIQGEEFRDPETGLLQIAWLGSSWFSRFNITDNSTFSFENHMIFHGNNAIREIEFLPGRLPHNVTAGVRQIDSDYILHFIALGDMLTFNEIDMSSLLYDFILR